MKILSVSVKSLCQSERNVTALRSQSGGGGGLMICVETALRYSDTYSLEQGRAYSPLSNGGITCFYSMSPG